MEEKEVVDWFVEVEVNIFEEVCELEMMLVVVVVILPSISRRYEM